MKTFLLPAFSALVLVLATISIVRTQPHREPQPPPLTPPQTDFAERVASVGLIEASSENISLSSHLPVYRLEPSPLPLFVGQQMDAFIDASGLKNAVVRQYRFWGGQSVWRVRVDSLPLSHPCRGRGD